MELRRFFSPSTIGLGTAIAAGASASSFLLAIVGFGRPYYASVFMPLAMVCLVALAWFMYLRDDGLARKPPAAGRPSGADAPDAGLFAPRDGGLLPRAPVEGPSGRRISVRAACVWAAVELGIASAVLYAATGLGASFYR